MKDGILALDKPEGISSAALVARVKKVLGVRKVGHTGTLDPFATGLMLCGINKGTRISRFLLGSSKSYIAGITLGTETDTLDATGTVINQSPPDIIEAISPEKILKILDAFRGVQMQHPPVYSALKHKGKPLYKLAREGRPIQKPPRKIEIHSLELKIIDKPCVTLHVHCSSGTYIRSLAHDMGQKLGCGAMLSSLRRTETCGVNIASAIPLARLETMGREEALRHVIPMAETLSFMPAIHADAEMLMQVKFGRPFRAPSPSDLFSSDLFSSDLFSSDLFKSDLFKSDLFKSDLFNSDLSNSDLSNIDEAHLINISLDDNHSMKRLLDNNYSVKRLLDKHHSMNPLYFRVIDCGGKLAAVVEYDSKKDRYDYCCVFAS